MSRPSQNQRGVPLRVTVSTKPPPKEERRFLKRLDGIWHLAAPAPLSPRWLCGDGPRSGLGLLRRHPDGRPGGRADQLAQILLLERFILQQAAGAALQHIALLP